VKKCFFGLEDNTLRSGAGPPPTTRLLNIILLIYLYWLGDEMTMMSVGAHTPGQEKIASINAQKKFFFHQLFSKKYLKGLSNEIDLAFDDMYG
jgi:hypothetical protein